MEEKINCNYCAGMNEKDKKILGHVCYSENKKIRINLSEEDLYQLQNGETFDWIFDGIDVHLFKGEEQEEEN